MWLTFSLQFTEPALNHDIICPVALPIHTLPELKAFQQSLVLRTGKLTLLIGVQVKVSANGIEFPVPLDDGQNDFGFEFSGILFFGMMVISYLI